MNRRLLSVLGFALVVSVLATLVLYRLIVTKLADSAKPASTQLIVDPSDSDQDVVAVFGMRVRLLY